VATIKPDSKKYFTISYEQARRYYALSATTEHLMIAKEFAKGKLRNYCSFLKQRYEAGMNQLLHELEERIEEINQAVSIEQVRGYEGIAARSVYAYFRALLDGKHQDAFSFKTRNRKAGDRMNAFLNFAYYLLFSWINTTVRAMGLNPYLGFLHSDNNNYESLVCDIEELFRARIDRLVIRCINTRIIKPDDFYEKEGRYLLSRDGMKKFIAEFENELERKNAKKDLSLKEEIHEQCQRDKDFFLRDDTSLTYYRWKV
jgi:CRISPR-associated protein Cas1